MKLAELLNRAVKPKLHERFGKLEIEVLELEESSVEAPDDKSDPELSSLSGLSLIIEYENAKGEMSQRAITCQQLSVRAGKEYLKAYCHQKKAQRTFRVDRFLDIFDAETGESLSPVQAFFAQFSPDKVTKSGLSWGLSVGRRADLIGFLNALIFLARCDKDYHPAERETLEQALTGFWLRLEIAGNPDFEDILSYADKLAPDGEVFWIAMHRFREDPVLESLFKRYSHILIEADGIVQREEAYWSLEIADFFSES